jgi:hypothetical protein
VKFTTGEQNLAKEFGLDLTKIDGPRILRATNPFSGDSVPLNQLEADIYNNVMTLYQQYCNGNGKVVGKYDRLKYLLLKINSDAYMRLID